MLRLCCIGLLIHDNFILGFIEGMQHEGEVIFSFGFYNEKSKNDQKIENPDISFLPENSFV